MPTRIGQFESSSVSSANWFWRSTAARIACRAESKTASASSPRISISDPPRSSTPSRTISLNLAASLAEASSPCRSVKRV